jgi:hypothetical protein
MRISKLIAAAALVSLWFTVAPVPGFAMGGGGGVSVGGGMSASGAGMTNGGYGGYVGYGAGSPAGTNPAVAFAEARQRDTQVSAEIEQARKAGKNVRLAEVCRRQGETALQAGSVPKAMLHFDDAERAVGIHGSRAASMGAYSASPVGSVAPGGTDFSGAVVH